MTAKGLNTEPDKTCRTIKANYAKISVANFESTGSWGGRQECVIIQGLEN